MNRDLVLLTVLLGAFALAPFVAVLATLWRR